MQYAKKSYMLSFSYYKMIEERWILSGLSNILDEWINKICSPKSLRMASMPFHPNNLEATFHKF